MGAKHRLQVRPSVAVAAITAAALLTACQSTDGGPTGNGVAATLTESVATTEAGTVGPTEAATETVAAQETDRPGASTAETATEEPAAAPETSTSEDTTEAEPTAEQPEPAPLMQVIEVANMTTFTTPAQAAYCIVSGPSDGMAASISCEVAQSSVPPGEPLLGVCAAEGIGWFFNFFADTGHGGFFCNHVDGITRGGGNPHYWQDDPWIDPDNVVTLPSGARVAVLDYGRVMRAGDMECTVHPDGLTCQASGSGRGFTVNSGSYTSW